MDNRTKLSIVEYGVGNIGSVLNACRRAGVEPAVAQSGADLASQAPTHILLPGVGAVGHALAQLRQRGFEPVLNALAVERGVPLLGICVGMQMLAEHCEEFGTHRGLGWIAGTVTSMRPLGANLKLPHVGWNEIRVRQPASALMAGLDGQHFYFVHSYAMNCATEYILCDSEYGSTFVSGVRRNNIHGLQFHPEKSNRIGVDLLANFFTLR